MTASEQIACLFGRQSDGSYAIPHDLTGDTIGILPLVDRLAGATGKSTDEVLSMSWIDLIENWLRAVVRTEALILRRYARENGLNHLEQTLAEALADYVEQAIQEGGE
ncbi:hypothetical protein ACFWYW_19770 [Nonomuraea sp. NPDC059023]|uniref:hypothetical protein n=1 Tax=unclassified Nonomuraea TaxID=2593643 RepID=UPI0036CAFBE0